MHKRIISPRIFFFFSSSNFNFWNHYGVEGVVKGQKMAQTDNKKFVCCHYVSQKLYIIWLWFLVHICKMMISPANFFISQNFDFWGFQGGGGGGKKANNDLKLFISVCYALDLWNCRSYYWDFDNDIYRCFSLFF